MQAQERAAAVSRQLLLLREAAFLDAQTTELETMVTTYNAQQRVFGMASIATKRSPAGQFDQEILVSAVNAAWPVNTLEGIIALVLPAAAIVLACVSGVLMVQAILSALSMAGTSVRSSPLGGVKRCRRPCHNV